MVAIKTQSKVARVAILITQPLTTFFRQQSTRRQVLPRQEPELVPPLEGELGVVVPDGRAQVEHQDVVVEDLQGGVAHPDEGIVVVAPPQNQARKPVALSERITRSRTA